MTVCQSVKNQTGRRGNAFHSECLTIAHDAFRSPRIPKIEAEWPYLEMQFRKLENRLKMVA